MQLSGHDMNPPDTSVAAAPLDRRPIDISQLSLRPNILAGKRILITGGGSGLGEAMAQGCAALGAVVYICGRRGGLLEQAATAINGEQRGAGRVSTRPCDLRSAESVDSMLESIWADGGALDGLVNNAAANFIARAEDISANAFDAIANTVMRGTFLVTTGCGKRWLASTNKASVVSLLTTWVVNGGPFATPAAMSKSGVWAMTQSLAVEWGGRGIRLNAICPGAFPTAGVAARSLTAEQGKSEKYANPMGRFGQPEDLVNLATFLLAPGSEFISGQLIAVDGAGYQGNGANFSALTAWTDADWSSAREKIRSADAKDKALRTTHREHSRETR